MRPAGSSPQHAEDKLQLSRRPIRPVLVSWADSPVRLAQFPEVVKLHLQVYCLDLMELIRQLHKHVLLMLKHFR